MSEYTNKRTGQGSESDGKPRSMSYEDFQGLSLEEVQGLINNGGLVIAAHPWDLFTQQTWIDDKKLAAASKIDQSAPLQVPAYVYEFKTRDNTTERRLVIGDGHHRLLNQWQPYQKHNRGQGVRLNVEVREVRSTEQVYHEVKNGASAPIRLTKYRNIQGCRRG